MAYIDSANESRTPALIGVAAIHTALGVLIVTGLAGGVMNETVRKEITSIFVPKPLPSPSPTPEQQVEQQNKAQTKVFAPDTPFPLDPPGDPVDTTNEQQTYTQPDTTATGTVGTGDGLGGTAKDPPRRFDPIAPRVRNGGWVTDNDYRTPWINRGWEGTAGFRLQIGADGRVDSCTITDSTGHSALDEATCRLVQRRARFDPARNERGEAVSGSFSSAVRWQIPE